MKALVRLNSALIVGCLRGFFGCIEQWFRRASLSLMKEQFSRLGKSAASNIFSGYRGERLISGLRRKDWILRALLLAVTSLWPQKVSSMGEFFSARWKLLLISDQAKNLVKNWFEGRGSMSRFQPHPDFIRRHRLLLLVKVNVANSVKKETSHW